MLLYIIPQNESDSINAEFPQGVSFTFFCDWDYVFQSWNEQYYDFDYNAIFEDLFELSLAEYLSEKEVKESYIYELPFSNQQNFPGSLDVTKDDAVTKITIRNFAGWDVIDTYHIDDLQAIEIEWKVRVIFKHSNKIQYDQIPFDSITIQWESYWDLQTTINQLNTVFSNTWTSNWNSPVINSPLSVNLVQWEVLNYELSADYGVWYERSGLPSWIITVDWNIRKLVWWSNLSVWTYNIEMKAINYYWQDTQTLTLNVEQPDFANTKSIQFNNNQYLWANAALLDDILWRDWNWSWSDDAWTISLYFKPGNSGIWNQKIIYFGWQSTNTSTGNLNIRYRGNNKSISFFYGTLFNNLELRTDDDTLQENQWHHIVVTYDGGTTWSWSDDVDDYYGRFKIFIDGVQQSTTNSNDNYWYSWSFSWFNFRMWRYSSWNYLRNWAKIDEVAIRQWDKSSIVSDIYNNWLPFDLNDLNDQPDHRRRMGDNATYPLLQDSWISWNCHFIMYNMTIWDIVSDVPMWN